MPNPREVSRGTTLRVPPQGSLQGRTDVKAECHTQAQMWRAPRRPLAQVRTLPAWCRLERRAELRALPAAPLLSAKEIMPPSGNETAPPLRECLTWARRPSASFLV